MKSPCNHVARPLSSAFTLIELLVVVAIISILASIAVPNFLDAKVRANVSRVKNDLRAISTAAETYHIDNDHYPYRRGTGTLNPNYLPGDTNPFSYHYGQYSSYPAIPERLAAGNSDIHLKIAQMSHLTTPIAYMTVLPIDVFDTHNTYPDNLLDYWDETQTSWFINSSPLLVRMDSVALAHRVRNPVDVGYMLSSVGPDGYLGAGSFNYKGWVTPSSQLQFSMYYGAYDPTNGTISSGNIYLAPQMGGLDNTGRSIFNKCFPEDLKGSWPIILK